MNRLIRTWRHFFDVRPGEYRRTVFMALYLLFVLFAYYVLKSASEAMFLNKFDIDKLPLFYIFMAVFGGAAAYVYSKLAARTSLRTAVTATMFLSAAFLVAIWFPLRTRNSTVVYTFAIWVRLFSIVAVTQGWVVASNLFNAREAKRVYGILTMGMVVGAMSGGEFTNFTVRLIGTGNLVFAAAPLVLIAYGCFVVAAGDRQSRLRGVKADAEESFTFRDIGRDIAHSRHLQSLITIMAMQFIVDTLIDYQFKYMAKATYQGDALTAFLGRFQGRYLNLTELALQLFFTTAVVKRLGVGGTMQVMPVSIAGASLFTVAMPSLLTASIARLTEASTRYTLARTANELFYMPLPLEMRNRIKAFIDIFMDRAARGISGVLLLFIGKLGVRGVAIVTIAVTIPWIILTVRAHREYVRTIRRRLEARRLDLESARVTVEDPATVRLLENTALAANPRQATYALGLLAEAPGYDLKPLLLRLSGSDQDEVRAKVYQLAAAQDIASLTDRASAEIRSGHSNSAVRFAVVYLLTVSPERGRLYRGLLDSPNESIQEGVIEALSANPPDSNAAGVFLDDWIARNAQDTDPRRRALAARVVGVRGDAGTEVIHKLLADPDPHVAAAACAAAAALRNRAYVFAITKLLGSYQTRGAAVEALGRYGPVICGTLGDMLSDDNLPMEVRANIPRALRRIPHQRSVDVLLAVAHESEPPIRNAALESLSRLRQSAPNLNYDDPMLTQRIVNEAHAYHELGVLRAALPSGSEGRGAVALLRRTLDHRMKLAMDRVFRLLGLRYNAAEMQQCRLAIDSTDRDRQANAVELLDNVLSQDLKRVLLGVLENPERVVEYARSVFSIEPPAPEEAVRRILHSGDPWLAACAMAAAAELRIRSLAAEIREVGGNGTPELGQVARSAAESLA